MNNVHTVKKRVVLNSAIFPCSSFRKVAGELVGLPRVKGVKDTLTLADFLFATIRDLKTL